ncbi:hypothetical protein BX600DRAFT_498192 [Xylariales sp. PMI_506]|nr:hypothetical protein BX600DRAFT_498192 [Xylariales sp. PMI_506]
MAGKRWLYSRSAQAKPSGESVSWRKSAVLLSSLTALLTIILVILFFLSVKGSDLEWAEGLTGTTTLFEGDCSQSSRLNIIFHIFINIIATAVLASSNFFMQILVAPTREEVDRAHTRGRWVEIGVQSWRNIRFVTPINSVLWVLLCITTIPLHLTFNSTILETKGSTEALFVMATDEFAQGTADQNGSLPIACSYDGSVTVNNATAYTLSKMSESLAAGGWEKLNLRDCYQRYNDTTAVLTTYRNAVLVISNQNESLGEITGWSVEEVTADTTGLTPSDALDVVSPLWNFGTLDRTDYTLNQRYQLNDRAYSLDAILSMDLDTGIFGPGLHYYSYRVAQYPLKDSFLKMQAYYCLSEPYTTTCSVDAQNQMFGIVCLLCFFKCIICSIVLLQLRHRQPLLTIGDAVESFIIQPDLTTTGMCCLSRGNISRRKSQDTWHSWESLQTTWKTPSRRFSSAIPVSIWIWSYLLISVSFAIAAVFYHQAFVNRSVESTGFGDSSGNPAAHVDSLLGDLQSNVSLLAILANIPQVVLSMCYLVYNGLFTRMCSEYEWATYSVRYQPLRVSSRKGLQRSTYRLQLPYHWTFPLLVVSTILHWLFSNCLYVFIFESYEAVLTEKPSRHAELLFSTVAILATLIVCVVLVLVPIVLALTVKLPGSMVIMGNCSVVISAACHCVPTQEMMGNVVTISNHGADGPTRPLIGPSEDEYGADETGTEFGTRDLYRIATGKLKWGVILRPKADSSQTSWVEPGHLAFASDDQDVHEVVERELYN